MNSTTNPTTTATAELSEMGKQIVRAVRILNAARSGSATGEATAEVLGATAAQVRGARLALVKRGLVVLVEGSAYLTATGEAVAEQLDPTPAPEPEAPEAAAEAEALGKRTAARRNVLDLTGVTGEALYRAMGRIEAQEGEGNLYPVGVPEAAAALYYSLDAAAWVWHGLKITRSQAGGLIEQGGKHFAG